MNYLLLLIPIGLIALFIWCTRSLINQSKKDWGTLYDLEKRVEVLKTKEEFLDFHKEFAFKANKIHNQYITPRLSAIDGYVKGFLKQFEIKK